MMRVRKYVVKYSLCALAAVLSTNGLAEAPKPSAAMAEALANNDKIVIRARVIGRFAPDYPDAAKSAGDAGMVEIEGVVLSDGSASGFQIVKSSAPKALETAMLAAAKAARFSPAKDKAYAAITSVIRLTYRFETEKHNATTLTWVEPPFDEATRAVGHNGKVVVTGVLDIDGKLTDVKVAKSSRSPILDAAALSAAQASLMRPYHDANGKPITIPATFPYEFNNYTTPGEGGGVLRYYCGQFAKDELWLRKVRAGDESKDRGDFYALMLGLGYIARGFNTNPDIVRAQLTDFENRWQKAIKTCSAQPNKLFVDVFKPEGPIAKALAKKTK